MIAKAQPPLRPALDFVAFELLVQFGWRMSVRGLQLLVVALCALAVPVVTTIAVVAAAFARAALESSGPAIAERAWIAVVALVLFNAYLAATYGFRETFSKRRFVVGGSPNAGLLRALDIPAVSMFVAACVVRSAIVFALATIATAAAVVVFGAIEPALAAALILMPVASGTGLLALAARHAARNTRVRPRIGARHAAVATTLVAGSGYLVAKVATAAVAASGGAASDIGTGGLVIGPVASWSALAVMIAVLTLVAIALHSSVGELRRHSFEIEQTAPGAPSATSPAPRSLVGVLHRELRSSAPVFLLQRTALVVVLAIAFIAGLRAGGHDLLPLDAGHQLVTRAALLVTFLTSLAATEIVLNVCGPVTLRNQLRYAWDCGAPVPRMLPGAVAYWVLPGLSIAIAAAVSLYLLLGRVNLSVLALGVATAAASLLAGAVDAVPRSHADGSGATSLFAAFLTVILSVPALAALVAGGAALTAAALLYVLILMGSASIWTVRRIRFLPFSSMA